MIDRAGQLQKTLTVDTAPESRTDEIDLLDANRALDRLRAALSGRAGETAPLTINHILGRVRRLLMLAGMRTAAVEILTAEPHAMKHNPADGLVGVHIWRMAQHIERDAEASSRTHPGT